MDRKSHFLTSRFDLDNGTYLWYRSRYPIETLATRIDDNSVARRIVYRSIFQRIKSRSLWTVFDILCPLRSRKEDLIISKKGKKIIRYKIFHHRKNQQFLIYQHQKRKSIYSFELIDWFQRGEQIEKLLQLKISVEVYFVNNWTLSSQTPITHNLTNNRNFCTVNYFLSFIKLIKKKRRRIDTARFARHGFSKSLLVKKINWKLNPA